MSRTLRIVSTMLMLVLALAGCIGTETGNPPFAAQMALDAHSSDRTRVAVRVSEGGAVVDQAWLVLGPIRFVREDACAAATGMDVTALGAADHARDGATFQMVDLTEGAYCRLGVPLLTADAAALPAGAPTELGGRSILFVGRTATGDALRIATSSVAPVRINAIDAAGFDMSAAEANVLLGFDVAGFLRGIDLDAATREVDGSVIIDDAHNVDLLRAFEANIGSGMELYRDPNGDGALGEPGAVLIARGG